MKVTLITHTPEPEKVIASAAKLCYSSSDIESLMNGLTTKKVEAFIKKLTDLGHQSPLEHCSFTFGIEGVSRACYDDKTEVLTNNGWKLFKNLTQDDMVFTRNEDGYAEFQKPIDYITYKYNGEMYHYKSQNVDLCVTPNHNLLMKKYDIRTDSDYALVPAENIDVKRFYMTKVVKYEPEISEFVTIKGFTYKRKNNQGRPYLKTTEDVTMRRDDFYKFLAWYISEGSVYHNKKENSYTVNITQTKQENISHILDICKNIHMTANYDGHNVKFKNATLGRYLKALGHSYSKHIPHDIFQCFNKDLSKTFIDEYIKGDGTVDTNGCAKIFTISPVLHEQLYTLSCFAGYSTSNHIDNRVGETHELNGDIFTHNFPCHVLNLSMTGVRNHEVVIKNEKHLTKTIYDGHVYCVEVPNHTLFVRRNGLAIWCGNCSHQLVRHRIASYSQKSQRYVKEGQFEYVVPPEIENIPEAKELFIKTMECDQMIYNNLINILTKKHFEDMVAKGMDEKKSKQMAEKKAAEDARFVLPNACETKIIMTMNIRSLLHFFEERCCSRAQWEIRQMANMMLGICNEKAPNLFAKAGASCVRGKCKEGKMSCGQPKGANK